MSKEAAFTLIELLVVISILALLVGILVPTLNRARQLAKATRCLANLRGVGQGLMLYQGGNGDLVVPSYNMPRPGTYAGAVGDVLDGWAVILERDALVPASRGLTSNLFYCPDTQDIEGMLGGQTGYDQDKPQGYQDWPIQWLTAGGDSALKGHPILPIAGFGDQYGLYAQFIRCGYWLNATNPIGTAPAAGTATPPCPNYTQAVGFGPYADGNTKCVSSMNIRRPQSLIVACDGMYMGRQQVTRLGEQNRRIGYRHPGTPVTADVNSISTTFGKTIANTVFADGHAAPIHNNDFPHGTVPAENTGPYSLLANP